VGYIYRKQIEEAEVVVINKIDLLTEGQRGKLREKIEREYPGRRVFEIDALRSCDALVADGIGDALVGEDDAAGAPRIQSATGRHSYTGRRGDGFDGWLEAILGGVSEPPRVMEVDYQRYGVGEALLGWLNATIAIPAQRAFEGAAMLHALTHGVLERLERAGIPVAHFKMILEGAEGSTLRVQVTREGEKPQFAGALDGDAKGAKLLINLRAEGDPERLAEAVRAGLGTALVGVAHTVEEFVHFRPGQPKPTHRVAELVG
jgi:hypothetical protein